MISSSVTTIHIITMLTLKKQKKKNIATLKFLRREMRAQILLNDCMLTAYRHAIK